MSARKTTMATGVAIDELLDKLEFAKTFPGPGASYDEFANLERVRLRNQNWGGLSASPKTPGEVTRNSLEALKDLGNNGGNNIEIMEGEYSNKDLESRMKKGSYAEVLEGKEKIEYGLTYIKSEEINGQYLARMSRDDLIKDLGFWDQAHIEERDEILKRKYYYFDNKPVYVQAWSPRNQIDITELKDVPIWVQFPGLNMKYWSLTGLSKLGSIIGKPVRRDRATAVRAKWGFARIQVEVHVQQEFPYIVHFADEEGRVISQSVEYEWKPTICAKCNRMGHTREECRKNWREKQGKESLKKVWRPKQKQDEETVHEEGKKREKVEVQEEVQMEEKEPVEDNEGFQLVSKKKSARRLTIDELYKGDWSDAPYT
ncbi:hypothetical protein DM860_016605 [Cuscuta australis]|uniref:CCHC-type domain-containing protein n=1 Tax=Cuscuta australis TaxID=267555 RepID=A0A328DRW6_9ASTE|nr:hypothetical protein DM860_016605 [Cuscuta australis]